MSAIAAAPQVNFQIDESLTDDQIDQVVKKEASHHKTLSQKVGIYSLELIRQIGAGTAAVLVATTATVGAFASLLAPAILSITGPATMVVAGSHIHEVYEEIGTAKSAEAKTIAKYGLANQVMFFLMGVFRVISCAVMTCEAIHAIAASSLVINVGMSIAFLTLHCVASVVYALRGAVLAYSAQKNLNLLDKFAQEFATLTPDQKIDFIKTEIASDPEYIGLRIDVKYLKELNGVGDISNEKFLKNVEKAIASKRLRLTIQRMSGVLMVVGAVLSALAVIGTSVGSCGLLPVIAAVAAALFFACAEVHFLLSYNSTLFEMRRDWGTSSNKPDPAVENNPAAIVAQPVACDQRQREEEARRSLCPWIGSLFRSCFDRSFVRSEN